MGTIINPQDYWWQWNDQCIRLLLLSLRYRADVPTLAILADAMDDAGYPDPQEPIYLRAVVARWEAGHLPHWGRFRTRLRLRVQRTLAECRNVTEYQWPQK